jgi:hypothetical protein
MNAKAAAMDTSPPPTYIASRLTSQRSKCSGSSPGGGLRRTVLCGLDTYAMSVRTISSTHDHLVNPARKGHYPR